eukprot:1188351-Prorocentrum_minimum.AAC.2
MGLLVKDKKPHVERKRMADCVYAYGEEACIEKGCLTLPACDPPQPRGPQDDPDAEEAPAEKALKKKGDKGSGKTEEPARNPLKGLLGSGEGGALRRVMYDTNPHSLARYLASTEAKPIRAQVNIPS